MTDCIFCKIVAGQIPARKVFENDEMLAFHDIAPAAPVHVLIIPKKHIESLAKTTPEDAAVLGNIMVKVGEIAQELGCQDGFRTIVNTGRVGGQEVYHLHVHLLSGQASLGPMLSPR